MKVIETIKRYLHHTFVMAKKAEDIYEGMNNQTELFNHKINALHQGIKNQSELINRKMDELIKATQQLTAAVSSHGGVFSTAGVPSEMTVSFQDIMKRQPLMLAPKTFNTNHPDYDAVTVRNFPGKIFHMDKDPGNPVYGELKNLIKNNEIADIQWEQILKEAMEEIKTVPHADQLFERKAYVDKYVADLNMKYGAYYQPGWVNVEDAIFLYWVVRKLKPKTIVQTGVCNGLSSAFMMLALAKNGLEGSLHVIDLPSVFDPNDPNWTKKGNVYGVIIPEGKTSGWLVPDAYRDRFEVLNGDAKDLLPGLLKKVGSLDMFYHDSDHSYDHMMFEFTEVKKYLTKKGVIVSDDISWNASLWDFADQYQVPAYNYRGSMGIACF